jgi:hypothetical protein
MIKELVFRMFFAHVMMIVSCLIIVLAMSAENPPEFTQGPESNHYMQLDGQIPVGRVLVLPGEEPPKGPGNLRVCMVPDCAEGCNSKQPNLFGNGLLYEESLKSKDK